jgi:hypothetical protein
MSTMSAMSFFIFFLYLGISRISTLFSLLFGILGKNLVQRTSVGFWGGRLVKGIASYATFMGSLYWPSKRVESYFITMPICGEFAIPVLAKNLARGASLIGRKG